MTEIEKIFAVGDIHGSFDKLAALLDKLVIDTERDTLLFIGDYVDRGPRPVEVVDRLVELRRQCPGIIFLKGNHEDMLLRYLSGMDRFVYLSNGGQSTLDGYARRNREMDPTAIPSDHLDFLESTVLYHETAGFIFVHAGLRPEVPLEHQTTEDLLWIREDFISSSYDFGKRVVFGHTPFNEPFVRPNKIGIDTGAVYGNKLTCLELPDMIFHQV